MCHSTSAKAAVKAAAETGIKAGSRAATKAGLNDPRGGYHLVPREQFDKMTREDHCTRKVE